MSLQDRIDRAGSVRAALPSHFGPGPIFPYPAEHSNWRDEQQAWSTTAVLFNQSWHMTDLYISGPDALKLLSDTSVNSYKGFGPGKAKQYLAVNHEGYVIADEVLFGLADGTYTLVGNGVGIHWVEYHAEIGDYDVTLHRDDGLLATGKVGGTPKRFYRYELEGPMTQKILEKAVGGSVDRIGFFKMADLTIAGRTVHALGHTMAAVPGDENTGLELFGPEGDHEAFLEAILEAGSEYGLVRGGALAYGSALGESGWIGGPVPAIYTSDDLLPYRQWLPDHTRENFSVVFSGSYQPDSVEGFYMTPWELGYGHLVKFDHDFIGREALEEMSTRPHGEKAWLVWNTEDTERILVDSALDHADRPRLLPFPMSPFFIDEVVLDGELVGISQIHAYTVNLGGWVSLASLRTSDIADGTEVIIKWGNHDGGKSNRFVPDHTMTEIRATVRKSSPTASS